MQYAIVITLGLLLGLGCLSKACRTAFISRTLHDWFIDGSALIWLTFIPIGAGYLNFFSDSSQKIQLPMWSALLLFLALDYAWYWNHRLFHGRIFWPVHRTHHTAAVFDALTTFRNSVWAPLFSVFPWMEVVAERFLIRPEIFISVSVFTGVWNIWTHTPLFVKRDHLVHRGLALIFVTPHEHAWHHSENPHCNYGGVLTIWDRLHGTFAHHDRAPARLGLNVRLDFWNGFLFPFLGKY